MPNSKIAAHSDAGTGFCQKTRTLLESTARLLGLNAEESMWFGKTGALQLGALTVQIVCNPQGERLPCMILATPEIPKDVSKCQWYSTLMNANATALLLGQWGFMLTKEACAIAMQVISPAECTPAILRSLLDGITCVCRGATTGAAVTRWDATNRSKALSPLSVEHPELHLEGPQSLRSHVCHALQHLDIPEPDAIRMATTGLITLGKQHIVVTTAVDSPQSLLLCTPLSHVSPSTRVYQQLLQANYLLFPSFGILAGEGSFGLQLCCRWQIALEEPHNLARWLELFSGFACNLDHDTNFFSSHP